MDYAFCMVRFVFFHSTVRFFLRTVWIIFSSPDLKTQVSFSDLILSVTRLFLNISLFSELQGHFQQSLAQRSLRQRLFKVVKIMDNPIFQGETISNG